MNKCTTVINKFIFDLPILFTFQLTWLVNIKALGVVEESKLNKYCEYFVTYVLLHNYIIHEI